MKRHLAVPILFLSMLACILPGTSPPGSGPLDPDSLPTLVVMTADAAMTQTAAAAPQAAPGTQPAPAAAPGTLEKLPDGTAKFTDHAAGYEVTFPTGWLTLRPNSEEFFAALGTTAANNEMLLDQMQLDMSDFEPAYDRLFSYPLRPDLEKNFLFGFSSVRWDSQDVALINENSMGEFVRDLEASGDIPGFRANNAQVYENSNQVTVIEVGGTFSIGDGQGGIIPFYLTAVFFKPNLGSTVVISITYLKDYQLPLSVDSNFIIASIRRLQ